jgi:hypothetical protein
VAGCGVLDQHIAPAITAKAYVSPYTGFADKTAAIVVYAPTAILDDYPGAREEISNFVSTQMRQHMATTQLVAPRDVIYWQDDTLNWKNLSARDIGRHFGVDRVLFIEVLDYSMRRPVGVSNLQGRLRAECRVYDTEERSPAPDANGHMAVAWTGLIDAAWPPTKPLDPTQIDEAAVRLRTLQSFADTLVRSFYVSRDGSPAMRG